MKLTSSIMRFAIAAGLSLVASAAASPAQHVFIPNRPQAPEPGAEATVLPAHHTVFSPTSSAKWERIESMGALPGQQLRIKQPRLCDANVTQYSGYLDTDKDHHFFFWFFEARNAPIRENAPVILWMNGGPGCSSLTSQLMELGPCRIANGGDSLSPNKYGWNDQAHIIFLDQPINVGFSYGKDVFDSITAGEDVYNFLQLFYHAFPEYSKGELHVFGESYGGHYAPATAKAIYEKNTELAEKQSKGLLSIAETQQRILPLTSVGMGNGLTDTLIQYKHYATMACDSTYDPIISKEQCDKFYRAYPGCAQHIQECYKWQNATMCRQAQDYCDEMVDPFFPRNVNQYDVRDRCMSDIECYPTMGYAEKFLNTPSVQQELGSDIESFVLCSKKVRADFALSGDWMKPYVHEIPPLLEAGIRVLVYAGDADFACNWYGNKAWTKALEWSGKDMFSAAADKTWLVNGKPAGESRTYKNFSFVRVFEAGHMVPYNQPENALDLINRWLSNKPLF
ncbi:hypothetical protein H4R20_002352 [Coemansia guatemalensis]|uniref:Carboxypeptidase n=1 Tax=Coemansia guatemalensis TaxID=2761395 RepID=A0A9W8HVB3_9FUNG|nr:hypothetical protein H4R20_002352 [Coemansia guatemalensis]